MRTATGTKQHAAGLALGMLHTTTTSNPAQPGPEKRSAIKRRYWYFNSNFNLVTWLLVGKKRNKVTVWVDDGDGLAS